VEKQLESLKWHLWHGNAYRDLQLTGDLEWDLDSGVDRTGRVKKLPPGRAGLSEGWPYPDRSGAG